VGCPKVLVAHNRYQLPGGEDEAFLAEAELLEARGHRVLRYCADNRTIPNLGQLALARATLWNSTVYRDLRGILRREKPAIVHFHNTFPLLSPAAYYAVRDEGIPVVQTLHNFRLICPNALLFRDGHTCNDCVGKKIPWPGVVHGCYRKDRRASAVIGAMLTLHGALRTWTRKVTMYIALTEFARQRFVAGGLPGAKIAVKPNFLPFDPGLGDHRRRFALFVGRLSPEKGVATLLSAWTQVRGGCPLKIVGSGPAEAMLGTAPREVEWLGRLSREQVLTLMHDAAFLVFPSECYEGFPVTLVEAFATGLPVIVSAHGSTAELVRDFHSGRHFCAGDATDLASKADWALSHPDAMTTMGRNARREFETRYTAAHNYTTLMDIYREASQRAGPEA
jgi:glycosyltransferase involved in cell wall biosynthesis